MVKVIFRDIKKDGSIFHTLFADNIVIGDNHVIVSLSKNYPCFRKTIIWNIPKFNYISHEDFRKE